MTFIDDVKRYKKAGFGALKIVTRDEPVCMQQLRTLGKVVVYGPARLAEMKKDEFTTAITVVRPPDRGVVSGYTRLLVRLADGARKDGRLIVILDHNDSLHPDIQDCFTLVRHPLPSPEDVRVNMQKLLDDNKMTTTDMDAALSAVRGMTSTRQENAFALSLLDAKERGTNVIDVNVLRRYKESQLESLGYLKVVEPTVTYDDLIGHDYLKSWLNKRKLLLSDKARAAGLPLPRGILCVGPPGTGKSRLAEAIAHNWGAPLLKLDVGRAMDSYLGESEKNFANALEVAERMEPCILLFDEVDYVFANSNGDRDGGAKASIVGSMLTWLATKTKMVFVILTSNRPWLLDAAMTRKGRIDETFFLDFPTVKEKAGIFRHYLKDDIKEGIRGAGIEGWSGSEIQAAVEAARVTAFAEGRPLAVKDLLEEIRMITPVSESKKKEVQQMRAWAKEFARPSNHQEREKGNNNG